MRISDSRVYQLKCWAGEWLGGNLVPPSSFTVQFRIDELLELLDYYVTPDEDRN